MDDDTGNEEEANFGPCVEEYLQKTAGEAVLRQQEQRRQHIGDLGDTGVGQTLLEVPLAVGQHGAYEHRSQCQHQTGCLDPCATQHGGAGDEVQYPDDTDDARLGDDARQQGAGGGGGHRVG